MSLDPKDLLSVGEVSRRTGVAVLSMKACYLLDPEDELAVEGSGPNRL